MSLLPAAAGLCALAGAHCGPPAYSGPASMPREVQGFVGELVEVGGVVGSGGFLHSGAPMRVRALEARCVDESVCETAIFDGDAVVAGKRTGATELALSYQHPTTHARESARVLVRIAHRTKAPLLPGPSRDTSGATLTLPMRSGERAESYACERQGAAHWMTQSIDPGDLYVRGEAVLFDCVAPVTFPSGASYLGRLPARTTPAGTMKRQEHVMVCAHREKAPDPARTIRAIWIYEGSTGRELALVERRGEPSDVCGSKARSSAEVNAPRAP